MSLFFNESHFRRMPIVGIVRFFPREYLEGVIPAVLAGGLCNLEITMNSAGAADLIRLTCQWVGSSGNVGAGTVTTLADLDLALEAGASFIVMPALVPEVISACVDRGVPVMPGALTPTEVLTAWRLGAKLVKVFPAEQLGPAHIRALKGPFPEIPLMATGGISVETLPAFKQAGADAFGVGSPLFDRARAAAGNWDWFRQEAERYVRAFTG